MVETCERASPDSVIIICGDFNHCNFQNGVPHYQQFVKCTTRDDKTLDLFFCNIKESYVARRKSPLGISDHNVVYMMPKYKQKLKREKPERKTVYVWDNEVTDNMICCMETTNWDVLFDCNATLDANVSVVTSYINFCMDNIVKSKVITTYPNNKPWVTKELKELINKKSNVSNLETDLN